MFMPIQAVDFVQVTSNEGAEKRPPQGEGGGGRSLLLPATPKFEPVSQSTKRMGNDMQGSFVSHETLIAAIPLCKADSTHTQAP
jgi:hypothetical protein